MNQQTEPSDINFATIDCCNLLGLNITMARKIAEF